MGYRGNTSWVTMRVGNQLSTFDAGTGVTVLGRHLLRQMPVEAHLFLTHCHWDRIQGSRFCPRFYSDKLFSHLQGVGS